MTMEETPKKLLYDVHEVAELLGLPVSKVRALAKSGALGSIKIGKYRRFSETQLQEFVEASEM